MGASTTDSNLIIISHGKKSYHSCHKGLGNILFELELGIFTNKKPEANKAFDNLNQYSWKDWIETHDAPLPSSEAVYGYLIINFDTNTVISRSGYDYPNGFNTQWILLSLRSIFDEKSDENVISDESIIYMFENGYMKMQNRKKELLDFNMSLKDFYEKTKNYLYDEYSIMYEVPELKELTKIFINLPENWTLINSEKIHGNYDEELRKILENQ